MFFSLLNGVVEQLHVMRIQVKKIRHTIGQSMSRLFKAIDVSFQDITSYERTENMTSSREKTSPYATIRPKKRSGSYRDPHLSDKWLKEAEWRVKNQPFMSSRDMRKIILRLIKELRDVNKETRR